MNLFVQAWAWLTDPVNWNGPDGIPVRIGEHLGLTGMTIALAALIALPLGILIGHTRRGAGLVGAIVGGARAIPTLGLLTLCGLAFGIGLQAPLVTLGVLAIPSLLAGAYAGIHAIDPAIPAAAQAIGMSRTQVVTLVEIPLALPVIVGGFRAATLQVVSTATLAAYISDTGLGRYLFAGLKSRDYPQMLAGALLVFVLALLLELLLAGVQRFSFGVANPARGASRRHSSPSTS